MKYELKLKETEIIWAGFLAIIGVVLFVAGRIVDESEMLSFGMLITFVAVAFIVCVKIKNSGDKFLFDENSFTVGEKSYSYSQIERIKATRFNRSVIFSIYVNGEKIFSFNSSYENINEFQRMLVMHNIHFNAYGD